MESLHFGSVKLNYKYPGVKINKQMCFENADSDDDCNQVSKEDSREPGEHAQKYEVEHILDRCDFGSGSVFYLVKWKFWNSKYNTWEPVGHLDCKKLIEEYRQCIEDKRYPNKIIDTYMQMLVDHSNEELKELMKKLSNRREKVTFRIQTEMELRKRVSGILVMNKRKNDWLKEKLKCDLMLKYLFVARKRQLMALSEWKEELLLTPDGVPVDVENDIDLESPPENFFYVNEYIPGIGVTIPEDPPVGCDCDPCHAKSLCCSRLTKFAFAYSNSGLLQVSSNTPIYECNKKCKCSKSCPNRVVQKGRQIQLCIYRTANDCGWGVKTLQDLKKGTYVCCYVGEVIRNEELDKRMEMYQTNKHTYLFDMDYNGAHSDYIVDATVYGNVSRFINHSCKPNLAVSFVWIDCLDPSLPKLAFFTDRSVRAGEELTFDYISDCVKIDHGEQNLKPCKCGADNCKRFIF